MVDRRQRAGAQGAAGRVHPADRPSAPPAVTVTTRQQVVVAAYNFLDTATLVRWAGGWQGQRGRRRGCIIAMSPPAHRRVLTLPPPSSVSQAVQIALIVLAFSFPKPYAYREQYPNYFFDGTSLNYGWAYSAYYRSHRNIYPAWIWERGEAYSMAYRAQRDGSRNFMGIIAVFFASFWFRAWRLIDAATSFVSTPSRHVQHAAGDLVAVFPISGAYFSLVAKNLAPIAAFLRLTPRPPMFGAAFGRPPGMGLLTWNISLNERYKDVSLAAAAWAVASLPLSGRAFACLYGASPWRWLLLPLHLLTIAVSLLGLLALYASLFAWSVLRRSDLAAVLRLLGVCTRSLAARIRSPPAATCTSPLTSQSHNILPCRPSRPADVPLIVLSGTAAGAVANQSPKTGRFARAERVLPVLLLNVVVPSLTLLLLAAMRLSARRARPPAAAAAAAAGAPAPSSAPTAADLRARFTDGDILAIISLLNLPLAISFIRVCCFLFFYPLPAPEEKPNVRRKFCLFLISSALLLALVLGLALGLPKFR
jgi:hypothetical protein